MRHQHLAAQLDTDLLEVDLESAAGLPTRIMATTFAHALQLAAAEFLEVDVREIKVSVHDIEEQTSWKIQLYDAEAGGSGHILELADRHHELLPAIKNVLTRERQHNESCGGACIHLPPDPGKSSCIRGRSPRSTRSPGAALRTQRDSQVPCWISAATEPHRGQSSGQPGYSVPFGPQYRVRSILPIVTQSLSSFSSESFRPDFREFALH